MLITFGLYLAPYPLPLSQYYKNFAISLHLNVNVSNILSIRD